ncbi:hypothetical protein MPSEU_000361900 [Mayamaea pseudoterrestris]|nr:hypothetical protein MPSEU_000361900 [Mayamaea pseudoterrestris]
MIFKFSRPSRQNLQSKMASQSEDLAQQSAILNTIRNDNDVINGNISAPHNELLQTVNEITQKHGPASVQLVSRSDEAAMNEAQPVKSLVFSVQAKQNDNSPSYILAILGVDDIVSRSALEEAARRLLDLDVTIRLAPSNKVAALCGFEPGTVPPLGLSPLPLLTLTEESLVEQQFIVGGGGAADTACLVRTDALMQQPNVHAASFRKQPWTTPRAKSPSTNLLLTDKPYFALETPDLGLVQTILSSDAHETSPLQPEPFSIVGRIRIVRRMARGLAFCDLGPPTEHNDAAIVNDASSNVNSTATTQHLPWRSLKTGQNMAVQLIIGKTLCHNIGSAAAEAVIKSLRVGELVLVQGLTNVNNYDSLRNWADKACLDLVVHSMQFLTAGSTQLLSMPSANKKTKTTDRRMLPRPPVRLNPGMSYLNVDDLYGEPDEDAESPIVMVDSTESVERFAADLSKLLITQQPTKENDSIGLVGIDTEWRPSFLFNNPNEPQVVLLLQICLHPLKQVYLLDLQTLLRPLRLPNEPLNPLETQVAQAVGELYAATHLFKVGFQVTNDLRRLAASYPHISAFQDIHSVLETSTLAKTVMRLKKLGNLREVTSSLSRLTEKFIGKTINKDNQCSDWSIRPLTAEQIEYAALDAMVTPCLVEKLLTVADARLEAGNKPKVGRWNDDTSFTGCVSSLRFLFLDPNTDMIAVKKLNAKRVIGSSYIVSQFWPTGNEPPPLPTIPTEANNGQYTGTDGILRVPSRIVSLELAAVNSMIGSHVGRSKERCLSMLLVGEAVLPAGAKLEFPQRSGFVEFTNAVALFVNLPASPGRGSPRSYPNEWLDNGRTLTWFLRESDWKRGTSPLAKKLCDDVSETHASSFVVLFVRSRDGNFVCCGHCQVARNESVDIEAAEESDDEIASSRDWDLVQLQLNLLDYDALMTKQEFVAMTTY